MRVTAPVEVVLPDSGLKFAESVHAQDFRLADRVDSFHKIIYVLAGRIEFARDRRPASAAPAGSLVFVRQGEQHWFRDLEPATVLLFCFAREWLLAGPEIAGLWSTLLQRPNGHLRLPGTTRGRIEALWRRALFEQAQTCPGATALLTVTATELLVRLARTHSHDASPSQAARVQAVAREIADSFIETWTIDHAALRAGMSRRSFTTHFRREMGSTFWVYVERLRIEHAARLLQAGEHSVLGVMFSSGFNDLSTFYRAFRRKYGVSPKQWSESRKRVSSRLQRVK